MQIEVKQRLVGYAVVILLFLLCLPIFLNSSQDKAVSVSSAGQSSNAALAALPSKSGPIHFQLPAQGAAQDNHSQASVLSNSSVQASPAVQRRPSLNNEKSAVNSNALHSVVLKKQTKTVQVSPAITLTERSVKKIIYMNKKKTRPPVSTTVKALTTKASSLRATKNRWVLQVASFYNKKNARKLLQRLRTQGYSSFLKESGSKGGRKMVKVLVGPYRSRSTLLRYQQRVDQQFKLNGIVRQHQI